MVSCFLDNQAHELLRYSSRYGKQFQTDDITLSKAHDGTCLAAVDNNKGVEAAVGTDVGAAAEEEVEIYWSSHATTRKVRRIGGNDDDTTNKDDEENAATTTATSSSSGGGGSSAMMTLEMTNDQANNSPGDDHENQPPFFSFSAFAAQQQTGKGGERIDDATAEREAECMLEQYLQVTNNTNTTTQHHDFGASYY